MDLYEYKKFSIGKVKFIRILEYVFVVLSILNCNSIYEVQYNTLFNSNLNVLWQSILILLVIFRIYKLNFLNIYNIFICSILLIIYITIFSVVNYINYAFPHYYYFTMLIDPILLIILFCSSGKHYLINNSLLLKLENVVIILSIVSLLFWIISNFGIRPNMNMMIKWGSTHAGNSRYVGGYFGIHFITQKSELFGIKLIRNTGIFAEAPMYSYVLSIALLIELFINKSKKIFTYKLIILLLTILSTTSTTGIMIALPAILYKEIISSKNEAKKIIFICLIPIILLLLKYVLFNKIGDVNNIYSSYSGRMNDISASISAWENHKFIGNGIGNIASIEPYMYSWRVLSYDIGLSNGFFVVLAYGGILYSLFYIIPTILSMKYSKDIMGFAIFSFILLMYTIVFETYICLIILSYFMSCFIKSFDR